MISREKYFKSVMIGTLKNRVQTLLRTKEYSGKFLPRGDTSLIDKEVERISGEVAGRLVSKLESRGLLEENSSLSEKEFESLFRSTIDEYFGELSEGKTG